MSNWTEKRGIVSRFSEEMKFSENRIMRRLEAREQIALLKRPEFYAYKTPYTFTKRGLRLSK